MSRANILSLVATRGPSGTWTMPAAVDGLRESETPSLYFHDVSFDAIAPWLTHFKAVKQSSKTMPGFQSTKNFVVTSWRGAHLGTAVEIKLYQEAP